MKRKLSAGLVAVAALAGIYFALVPRSLPEREAPPAPDSRPGNTETVPEEEGYGTAMDEERYAAMTAAYAELEQARRDLKRRLDEIRARLWRVELPVQDAGFVQRDLMYGYSLLKNPPLLGAFQNAQGIDRERDRIQTALARLSEVEKRIESMSSQPGAAPVAD